MRFRFEVRLTPADVGQRVVIRWRKPGDVAGKVTDVLGTLEDCDGRFFSVRTARGELVVVPGERARRHALSDSLPTASLRPPSVHAQQAGLNAPVEAKASLLDGFHAQPSCSWVPPTETTYSELAGHHTAGSGHAPLSLCSLLMPKLPKSPGPQAARASLLPAPSRASCADAR
ncbi:MAG TPA: hypothetical protein VGR98_23180 [Streptosporangiaceae bacterium]|nr:hypothetical protein [Streptosporangiaceae bacterium]